MSVRLTARVSPPLLAEATIVYVPAGVTGLGVGFAFELLCKGIARPAPHPVAATRQPSRIELASHDRRFLRNATRLKGNSVASQTIPGRFVSGREVCAVDETPVRTVTETVVVLPSATVEGVMLQVEFAGAPVHVKVAVPGIFAAELSSNG
jgi:hypothetical protein